MESLKEFLNQHQWSDTTVETEEGDISAVFFDWKKLPAEDKADLFEYFTNEDTQKKIEKGEWLPIAVLDMYYGMDSFAEMNNKGILVVVQKDSEYKPGTVLWFCQDNDEPVQELAESLDALKVKNLKEEKEEKVTANDSPDSHLEPPYKELWDSSIEKSIKKDLDGAIADLKIIMKELPGNIAVLKALAQVSEMKSEFDTALEYVNKALSFKPNDFSLLKTKGEILISLKHYDGAIELSQAMEKIARDDDDDSDLGKALALRGIALVKTGKTKEAKPLIEEAEEKGSFLSMTFSDYDWAKEEVEKV
ncbi:MAG: hypothetical protein JNL74_03860 [Fibrobacteres bacterium]|nr:hypothetical protein [Fibrobacterota bacterium]